MIGSDTCPDGRGFKVSVFHAATILVLVAFDGDTFSEAMSLQIGLVGRDRFLIPFKTNARQVRNVKQSVTNFIGLL